MYNFEILTNKDDALKLRETLIQEYANEDEIIQIQRKKRKV